MGATGYTGLELLKLLLRHPHAQVEVLTSRRDDAPHVGEVHPELFGRLDLRLENLSPAETAARCDCVFACLPHGAAAESVVACLDAGVSVIDLSADFRLRDAAVYERWYGLPHAAPDRLPQAVYGLCEQYGDQLKAAKLVANPGCYPTSAILPLAPLLSAGLIESQGIIIDSKSGVSGAGRTPKPVTHFPECNESIAAYNIGKHRHTPEIEQELSVAAGSDVRVVFTPHLTPMNRGILSTIYARPAQASGGITRDAVLDVLRQAYADRPFIRITDHLPATRHVAGTNFCDISAEVSGETVVLVAAIDNLTKGASGAAVQNFNLMHGFDETTALT
jgi:N-acetyl-gamma-glutamyl-phosphate reductase